MYLPAMFARMGQVRVHWLGHVFLFDRPWPPPYVSQLQAFLTSKSLSLRCSDDNLRRRQTRRAAVQALPVAGEDKRARVASVPQHGVRGGYLQGSPGDQEFCA